jgi:hypothetical protein
MPLNALSIKMTTEESKKEKPNASNSHLPKKFEPQKT